ncbi:MAG: protein translocase SEC61 complex subunit gamma [Candidatus Aminicenantales bacterium]
MPDIKAKLREYRRVLQISRKPSRDEFTSSSKICAIGMVLIGLIGFAIFAVFVLLGV